MIKQLRDEGAWVHGKTVHPRAPECITPINRQYSIRPAIDDPFENVQF